MKWRNPLEPRNDLNTDDESDPFGRVAPKAQPESLLANLGDASKLDRPVGEQGKNDRRDVAKVETMLGRTGALDLKKTDGPTGYWGARTKEATRKFQKQHKLKVDGQINPGGETIRTLAKVAGGLNKTLPGNTRHPREAGGHNAGAALDSRLRGKDQVEQTQRASFVAQRNPSSTAEDDDLADPTSRKPPAGLPPYALPDAAVSANLRLARALGKRKGIGDLDRFTTDAINKDGEKAVYEVADLINRVRATDLAQADELLEKTNRGIAPANVRLLARIAAADGTDVRQVVEPARRYASAQQTPEPQNTRNPSSPKDEANPSAPHLKSTLNGGAGEDALSDGEPTHGQIDESRGQPSSASGAAASSKFDPLEVTIRPADKINTGDSQKPGIANQDGSSQQGQDTVTASQTSMAEKLLRIGMTKKSAAELSKDLSDDDIAKLEEWINSLDENDPGIMVKLMTYLSGLLNMGLMQDNTLQMSGTNPPRG